VTRVLILVEGQTEETFVKDVLGLYLAEREKYLQVTILKTRREIDMPDFRGGVISYKQIRGDVWRLLNDTGAAAVTTMLDFYGLPRDFPGLGTMPPHDGYKRVTHLEDAFATDIAHRRFLPHLTLHEFEALMFTDPGRIADQFPDEDHRAELHAIRDAFDSPEEINDDPRTAPSKRLIELFGEAYQKTLYGPVVTMNIGIDEIRRRCRHFNEWVEKLEAL
jgi:hypothetical protein